MAVLLKEGVLAVKLDQDIQDFIKANVTGKTPPAHVQYQPQASEIIGHMVDGKSSSSNNSLYQSTNKPPTGFTNTTTTTTTAPTAPPLTTASTSTVNTPKSSPLKPEIKKAGPPANEAQEWYARALYDFESEEPDDLPFPVDAVIKLLQWSDTDDWWQGELNVKRGMFPKNYVEKSLGPPKKSPPTVNVPSLPVIHQNVPITNNAGAGVAASPSDGAPRVMNAKCEALFDFDGQDNDDLPFKKGDILIITGELDGWYLGKTLDGARTGIFPSNYVKVK